MPHNQAFGVAQRGGIKLAIAMNLDDRQIIHPVDPDDLGAVSFLVRGGDFNLVRVGDHMEVGEDVSLAIDDEARALSFFGHLAVEEVKLHRARGDVDH